MTFLVYGIGFGVWTCSCLQCHKHVRLLLEKQLKRVQGAPSALNLLYVMSEIVRASRKQLGVRDAYGGLSKFIGSSCADYTVVRVVACMDSGHGSGLHVQYHQYQNALLCLYAAGRLQDLLAGLLPELLKSEYQVRAAKLRRCLFSACLGMLSRTFGLN